MNPIVHEMLSSETVETPSGERVSTRPQSISYGEAEFIHELIRRFRPKVSLEVGMAMGVSSVVICDALKETEGKGHIIIDPMGKQDWVDIARYNLDGIGFIDKVRFYASRSQNALPKLLDEKQTIDFAMIDGWHTFDFALMDFFYIDKMLNVGGVVVFDDADWPSIRKVCRYVATNFPYTVILPDHAKQYLKFSWTRKVLDALLKMPGIAKVLRKLLKPEVINSDKKLGLSGSMIAFKKENDSRRSWDFHMEF